MMHGTGFRGLDLIIKERERQWYEEKFNDDHDEIWTDNELVRAAYCYMLAAVAPSVLEEGETLPTYAPELWPFDERWWKPTYEDPQRMLVKAGALIAAEIDRRQLVEIFSGNSENLVEAPNSPTGDVK